MLNARMYVEQVQETVNYIKSTIKSFQPIFCLVLGSGLNNLEKQIKVIQKIRYQYIPNFPQTTVSGHNGEMIFGYIYDIPIVALSGRKHYYEVADDPLGIYKIVFPVHVMASLGVKIYFSTNAVGGLNPKYDVGDLMLVEDHIDLYMPDSLTGPHLDFGNNEYFQTQNNLYNEELREVFLLAAKNSKEEEKVHEGILTARTGRTFETAAVNRLLREEGADAVGMSVIPEVKVSFNRGMKVIAVSLITNVMDRDGTNDTSHEEVTEVSKNCNRMAKVTSRFFEIFHESMIENRKAVEKFFNS